MQSAPEAPDLIGLLTETRAALAHLRADELEALAQRAEAMLLVCSNLSAGYPTSGGDVGDVAATLREHTVLGDLLTATRENLRVLRRTRNSAQGGPRWIL